MCVCVCACVLSSTCTNIPYIQHTHANYCVCVCVLLSNKYPSVISFNIFLISTFFFTNNTVSVFESFMTISMMNTKSGTNGNLVNLLHRIKCGITLDLQKQKI